MNLVARTVTRGGEAIDLQPREFRLLEFLLRNEGRLVTRKMLLEHVWEFLFDPQTNIVETHISRLRTKIDRGRTASLIHTIRGAGYLLRKGVPMVRAGVKVEKIRHASGSHAVENISHRAAEDQRQPGRRRRVEPIDPPQHPASRSTATTDNPIRIGVRDWTSSRRTSRTPHPDSATARC